MKTETLLTIHRIAWGIVGIASAACSEGTLPREDSLVRDVGATGPSAAPTATGWTPPEAPPPGSPVALHGQLRVDGTNLVDEAGNPVQLRGISTQWLNWESGYADVAEAYVWLRDNWNVELIRGAMGVDGGGDAAAYLQNPERARADMERVLQNAIDAGLYVIIDWHDHDAPAHRAEAETFFDEMALEWGTYPNVIYETYNEPVPDWDWSTDIKPYHEAVLTKIRAQDPDGVVVLGNPFWSQRPNEAAQDPVAGDNLMYTVHFYSCDHAADIRNQAIQALDLGVAIFVTEWGATPADGGVPLADGTPPATCEAEADAWHEWMNANDISWAAWKFEGCADTSCLFKSGTPRTGGFTDEHLNGHGPYVRSKLMAP